MNQDKAYILRKSLTVITLILIVATLGIILLGFSVKTITINYFGEIKTVRTLSSTVEDFLIENKIYENEIIKVEPNVSTLIENGLEIKVYSTTEFAKLDTNEYIKEYKPTVAKVVEVIDQIPYSEEKTQNSTIERGTTSVIQEGIEGQKVTRYLIKYSGEEEIYKAEIDTKTLSDPQNKIIEVGTKINLTVSRSRNTSVDNGFKEYNINLSTDLQKYAYNMCKKYGIQYELFLAMLYQESKFNPNAIGGGNSYGMAQIHISNHASLRNKLGITNFLDPYDSITAGAYMLSIYFGSARKMSSDNDIIEAYALNSYNMGEGIYYNNCFSKGTIERGYSKSIKSLRDRIINNGGL